MLASSRLSNNQTNVVITTTRAHGFESAVAGFPLQPGGLDLPGWLERPLDAYVDFGHATVTDGAATLFQGRASGPPHIVGGRIMGTTLSGYWDALSDGYYYSSDSTPSTSEEVIKDILFRSVGFIALDSEHWASIGVVHACSDFDGQRPGAAIQTMLTEGGGTPCDLQFWDGPRGAVMASLHDRTAPAVARYAMDWIPDTRVVDVTYNPQQLYGHFQTRYTVPGGSSESVTGWSPALADLSFADVWRVDRSLELSGGQLTAAGATALRDTTAATQSIRQWGGTIRCSRIHPLQSIDGATVTRAHVRAGEWLVLRGLTNDSTTLNLMLQIQETQYDIQADTLQITVSQGMTLRGLDERIIETTDATRAGRNAVSGAKAS